MSNQFDSAWLAAREARNKPEPSKASSAVKDGSERAIHDQIEATLKFKRWYYVHSRMDKPATNQVGTCDFIIAAPGGRTFWIEVKRKGGKLTPDQSITRHILMALGHKYAVVYSYQNFLEAITTPEKGKG